MSEKRLTIAHDLKSPRLNSGRGDLTVLFFQQFVYFSRTNEIVMR